MNNKKLLLYGSISALLLVIVIAVFFAKLFSPSEDEAAEVSAVSGHLYATVPSDAVMLLDIKDISNFSPMLEDTASFAYNMLDRNHGLSLIQQKIADIKGESAVPVIYSLHYSSKNDVSLFMAADVSGLISSSGEGVLQQFMQKSVKRYNKTPIYKYNDIVFVAVLEDIIIASSSLYVIESSIRHTDNATSILDNAEFASLYAGNANRKSLYINHHQIGKFFSGVVTRGFLKYSDFFLRYASWSCFNIESDEGLLALEGRITNHREEKYNSSVLYSQTPQKSSMCSVLPKNTVFAVSLTLSNIEEYLNAGSLFLEVHKKLSGYKYKQHITGLKDRVQPMEYVLDSLDIEELVSAYCKFGDKYEWLTLIREKSSFGLADVVGSVIDRQKEIPVEPYELKGYIESVFGEVFSHCNEEAVCKIDGWQIIGPKEIVADFASGNANYSNLEYYLKQTPVKNFFDKEGVIKIAVYLKEGQGNIMPIIKPLYGKLLNGSLNYKNFEFAAANITSLEGKVVMQAAFHAVRMETLPLDKPREEMAAKVFVDSTIVVDNSSFELKDFTTGGKCYLEQLPNNKIRMLDGKRKGLWTIPFETPLCGAVAQVDYFKNNKLQMLFISGNKLYLLDRVGRIVRGFPVTLPQNVVYGPHVLDLEGDKNYSFMVLNEDNSIAIHKLNRDNIGNGIIIKSADYVKELPVIREINGKEYFLLKTVQRLRIYNLNGEEIVIKDKKRAIDPNSGIELVAGSEIKVLGVDGKEFIVDIATGKTRKL